ncbi:MAG TPA: GreA/GreB family elongation factor [Kofleriaceae bacterium]|nr:GreA/GreB family elongation factor [Kofleriaceae bacterium]
MSDDNEKERLRHELHAHLVQALETARVAHAAAVEGATHSEAKAENDKDTRGLEQSYLARGQAQRVAELDAAAADVARLELRACTSVSMGALVVVDDGAERRRYFVAPGGGGSELANKIQVITPVSPLGRALLGKRAEDVVEFRGRELEVIDVR